jgi:hemerythrin-like domain-containing protein
VVHVIDTLRLEHRNISLLLDALEHQIGVFARAGKPDYDVVRGIADYFLDYPDSCHHPKEDVVFERLRMCFPHDAATIEDLVSEHQELGERARRFRDIIYALLNDFNIARGDVVDAVRDFIETQRRHMAREEERFFPLAEAKLTPADWSRIAGDLAGDRDPLFGDRVEEDFKDLRERLLVWEKEYRIG